MSASLCDRPEESLTATAATRRRLLDALLAETLATADDRELETAESNGDQPRYRRHGWRLVRHAAAAAEPCRGQFLGAVGCEFSCPSTGRVVPVQAPRTAQR